MNYLNLLERKHKGTPCSLFLFTMGFTNWYPGTGSQFCASWMGVLVMGTCSGTRSQIYSQKVVHDKCTQFHTCVKLEKRKNWNVLKWMFFHKKPLRWSWNFKVVERNRKTGRRPKEGVGKGPGGPLGGPGGRMGGQGGRPNTYKRIAHLKGQFITWALSKEVRKNIKCMNRFFENPQFLIHWQFTSPTFSLFS